MGVGNTISGAHLDVWMGLLWHHLNVTTTEDDASA